MTPEEARAKALELAALAEADLDVDIRDRGLAYAQLANVYAVLGGCLPEDAEEVPPPDGPWSDL